LIALLHTVTLLNAATRTSTATGGAWGTKNTWVGRTVPGTADIVIIATTGSGQVSLGAAASCTGVTVNSGSILAPNGNILTVNGIVSNLGTITITTGGITQSGTANFTNSGAITLTSGKITQSGTGDFTNNGTITFSGTGLLTLTGSYTNAGTLTLGATPVTIAGANTAASIVAGFTTSGLVTHSRTAGSTTFTGNVGGAGLTVSGTGGTLNLGAASLNHTFTGAILISAGTLNGGSSTLHANFVGAAWSRAGTFTAGTGTVDFGGAGNQSIAGTTISFNNLTFSGSGTKSYAATPTVIGILSIEGSATLAVPPIFGAASTIQYKGTGSTRTISFEFPTTFSGTGGVIIDPGNGNTITLNESKTSFKGDLHLLSGTLDLAAYTMDHVLLPAGGTLSLAANTTLRIGGATLPSNYTTHSIDAASTVDYDGTNQAVAGFNSSQSYGNLILSGSGTKTLAASIIPINGYFINNGTTVSSTGNTLTFSGSSAQYIGGTTITTFNDLVFNNASGVTMNIGESVDGDFTISSGASVTLGNYSHNLGGSFANNGGTLNATGSTLTYNGATAQTVGGTTTSTFNNLAFSNSSGVTMTIGETVSGTFTIGSGASVSLGSFSHNLGGNFANNGGTLNATGSTLVFNGGSAQTIGGSTTSTFNNLTFSNTSGVSMTIGETVNGTFTVSSGASFNTGSLSHTFKGDFANNGSTLNTTGSTLIFNGTSAQSIGGTTSTAFNNLTLDNTSGVTLSFNQTVNGVLTLTNGLLNTGSNTLTVGCSGSIANASASRYVNGKLALVFCSSGSRVFPIGKGGNYRPLTLNYTALTGSSTVTSEQIESALPGTIPSDIALFGSRYWQLSQTGSSSYSFCLTLDGTGWSPTSYLKMLKGNGSTNAHYAVTTPNYTNSTDFTSFGNFGLGQLNCVTWLGSTNNWFTASNWTSGSLPTSADDIRIPSSVTYYPSISNPGNDINIASAGKLQVQDSASLTLENGPLLTFLSGATVSTGVGSKIVLKSGARYLNLSSSTPTLEVQRQLTGTKGWRMLASPVATTFSDMFKDSLVTQGFTGSDFPTLQPNLLWWDETDIGTTLQSWRKPSNLTQNIDDGSGYFHYVFNGAGRLKITGTLTDTNYVDVLPITLSATGVENYNGTSTYDFGLTYTTKPTTQPHSLTDTIFYDLNALDQGWNLIGNPTASTLDWDASSGWTKTNVENSIYIWDPSANSGEGEYLVWNGTVGTLGSGKIPPFQAFWVHVTDSTTLKFTNDVKIDSIGTFLRSSQTDETISLPITLSVGDLQTTSYLSFSEDGITGPDRKDAYRLQSMSDNWLGLYSLSSAKYVSPLVINHLPLIKDELITIPLYYDAQLNKSSTNQSYTLNWKLPDNWPSDWRISLQDHKTEASISMTENSTYSFGSASNKVITASANKLPLPQRLVQNLSNPTMLRSSSSSLPPFTVVISRGKDIDYIAPKPKLLGNYPNPFEKLTTVRFSLPEKAKASVELYSAQGIKIAVLADGLLPAGITEVQWNATSIPPGIYFIRFKSGESVETKKAILID